jgi:hypothetical protein
MRIYRKRLLAAELCVEMPTGLHVLEAKLMERGRRQAVVTLDDLIGFAGDGPAFTTVHIGAFRPLQSGANS